MEGVEPTHPGPLDRAGAPRHHRRSRDAPADQRQQALYPLHSLTIGVLLDLEARYSDPIHSTIPSSMMASNATIASASTRTRSDVRSSSGRLRALVLR